MNRLPAFLATFACLVASVSAQTLQSPPSTIDYQGRVLDANNQPLAPTTPTNYRMEFRIYSTPTGGTPVWAEAQIVTVANGQFSVRLGEGTQITTPSLLLRPNLNTVFDQNERYLGITVDTPSPVDAEILPRLQFLTTPYAMTANKASFATTAAVANQIVQTTGTSSLGATTVNGNLAVVGGSNRLTIQGANVIEFGQGVATKGQHNGTIGYGAYTTSLTAPALDIVGAGTSVGTRQIKLWAADTLVGGRVRIEGSNILEFGNGLAKAQDAGTIGYNTYSITVPGNNTALDIVGAGTAVGQRRVRFWSEAGVDFTGNLTFGARTAQHLNLWNTDYGFGVQNNTLYSRSDNRFSWFLDGSHNDAEDNPGSGGSRIMTLSRNNGLEVAANKGQSAVPGIVLGLDNGDLPGFELRQRGDINDLGSPSFGAIRSVNLGYLDFSGRDGGDFDARMIVSHTRTNLGSIIQAPVVNFQSSARNSTLALQVNGIAVSLSTSCDLTLKDDVLDYSAGLETILALRPVDFIWRRAEFPERRFPEGRHVGIIAQEIQPLVPDAVSVDSYGKLSVDFSKLVPHLVGAVQAQQAQIEKLENDNRALEARLARLEAALARLAP